MTDLEPAMTCWDTSRLYDTRSALYCHGPRIFGRRILCASTGNQSINQLLFCPIQRKKKHNIIIRNITVRAGETPKKTARQSLT